MLGYVVVFVTAPSEEEAVKIANGVIGARLAACANIVRGLRSIYRWHGKVEDEQEVLLTIKTRRELFPQLAQKIRELHSYTVPEIIAVPIVEGSADYLNWIGQETRSE